MVRVRDVRLGKLGVGSLAMLMILAACTPAAPAAPKQEAPAAAPKQAAAPGAAPAAPAAPASAGQPQRGGVFVTATPGRFTNCNAYDGNNRATNITVDHLYETLVRYAYAKKDWLANYDVTPWLAEKWEQPDPSTLIFRLRQTNWHDGKPFGADDVVGTYELLKAKNYSGFSNWRQFKSVEKVDDHSVKFTLEQPTALWQVMASLGDPSNAQILPKHIIDAGKLETDCIGTGPFKMQSISATTKAVMVRNESYWGRDANGQQLPYLDGIEEIYGMDRSALQGAFAAGELDMISISTGAEMDALAKQYASTVNVTWLTDVTHGLIYNFGRPQFEDKRVRQAINLLVDRQKIVETAWFGKAVPSLPVAPAIRPTWGLSEQETLALPGFRADKTADIAEGKKLLAEAGYGPGKSLSFGLTYINTFITAGMAPLIASDLKQYGIDVQLNGIDSATFARNLREGNYDMSLYRLSNSLPQRDAQQRFYTKSAEVQASKMPDVGQDKLFDQLRQVTDVNQQKTISAQIQKLILDEQLAVPLVSPYTFAAVQPWVNNYRPALAVEPDVTASAHDLWLDKSKLPAKRKS
jgi:peptide/nickel transport system substrate-binding protein